MPISIRTGDIETVWRNQVTGLHIKIHQKRDIPGVPGQMEQVHILNFCPGYLGFSYLLKAAQIQTPVCSLLSHSLCNSGQERQFHVEVGSEGQSEQSFAGAFLPHHKELDHSRELGSLGLPIV